MALGIERDSPRTWLAIVTDGIKTNFCPPPRSLNMVPRDGTMLN